LHHYLAFNPEPPPSGLVHEIAAYILNNLCRTSHSISQFRKNIKRLTLPALSGAALGQTIDFEQLSEHLRTSRELSPGTIGEALLSSDLLDSPVTLHRDYHMLPGHTEAMAFHLETPYGASFPIRPALDREGFAFASFQGAIQSNLLYLRRHLVETSDSAVNSTDTKWLNTVRALINECISLIEITLHQLYYAAEYQVRPGWRFDPDRLGSRYNRRFNDKLKWVGEITGRHLDNAQKEIAAVNELREVRNHLNLFDPPCVAMSIEDVAHWANLVPKTAGLAWKLRSKLGEQITPELIQLLLVPKVVFVPRDPNRPRDTQTDAFGYRSSCQPAPSGSEISAQGILLQKRKRN
jgi:hypothetical protein